MQVDKIGADPERECEHMHAVEIYKQMLLPTAAAPLIKTLHEALNIDKSLMWQQVAAEFDDVNEVAMHESVADENEEQVEYKEDANIGELERLLTVGKDLSVEELERVLAGV
jgi:hypothetical protein